MIKKFIPYHDEKSELEAFVAYPSENKRPIIILCHAWAGRDHFIQQAAERIAQWGYIGFALDMYGKNVIGTSKKDNAALKAPFINDRAFLQKRLLKGYELACSLENSNNQQIAVLGFGFGGICALDLARSGVPLQGAISVYGHFESPNNIESKPIQSQILILHGFNDPIATVEQLYFFGKELDKNKVTWQANLYGNTMHAFVNPHANDPESGIMYNPIAAKTVWQDIEAFLKNLF